MGASMKFRTVGILLACLIAAQTTLAQPIRLTMYGDGDSCPGGCDAHVVFHPTLNGTTFAHLPTTPVEPFAKCVAGANCSVCFISGDPNQCMTIMYRGAGPHRNTFDLTPAFYTESCAHSPIPGVLATQCKAITAAARTLDGRLNCFRSPAATPCADVMAKAQSQKKIDQPKYEKCKAVGEAAFNRHRSAAEQRIDSCAYEKKGTGGPNCLGATWRRLLPAACRTGSFVGRDGLDCCTGNPQIDGPLGAECRIFYPKD